MWMEFVSQCFVCKIFYTLGKPVERSESVNRPLVDASVEEESKSEVDEALMRSRTKSEYETVYCEEDYDPDEDLMCRIWNQYVRKPTDSQV